MAVAALAGGIAVFLAGLAVGLVVANVFVLRHKERRSRVLGKVRALRATGRGAGLSANNAPRPGQPGSGPWR